MNPDLAIIVYRSQTEANQDIFIQWMFLWAYEHWYFIVGAIVIGALWYAVVNKNNMKEIRHFPTADCVAAYFLGKKCSNYLILINEQLIFHTNEWLEMVGRADVSKLQKDLEEMSKKALTLT